MKNNRKRQTKGILKGTSASILLSLIIHGLLFFLAGLLVVFTVIKQEEAVFDPPKAVERPKMKLKKPKVRIRKSRPRSTVRIVTESRRSTMPTIQLPDISSMGDGLGEDVGFGGGFDMMDDFDGVSIFGSGQSIGNDFEGVVYSLNYGPAGPDGGIVPMERWQFCQVVRKYVLSGWKNSVLAPYYKLPKKLYSTYIMVPPIPTAMAPGIFGARGVADYYLFVKYEGQLTHKEDIRFRFWGVGDAYIFVHVDGKPVLVNCWFTFHPYFDWWESTAGFNKTYLLGNQRMAIGDWIELKAGEAVDMKVLFGEWRGGSVTGMLLVEVDGVEYPRNRDNGPLLPIFKTAELSWDSITEISRFLAANECSLTNGPVFNDYYIPQSVPEGIEDNPQESGEKPTEPIADEPEKTQWTLVDGRLLEGEFLTEVSGTVILKNARGKQIRVTMRDLTEADRSYILHSIPPTLNINFSKTSTVIKFGPTSRARERPVKGSYYTFSTHIKKTSLRPYDFGLTAECFVIGSEIGGNKRILLNRQKIDFNLKKESGYTFEFSSQPVELIDYNLNSERRGQEYSGHLVVISDSRGEIITYKTTSENLYRNFDNLRKLKSGWYFDRQCVRCLPTPPRPWAEAEWDN